MKYKIKEAARFNREDTYKKSIQEYRDNKQQINELLTLLALKEADKWSVADQKKMVNRKKVKDDGATPARKKDLLVLWDLVRGRPKPTPPKRSKEETDMDGGVDSEDDDNL